MANGIGRRLGALEERLGERAGGWRPGERELVAAACERLAAEKGVDPDALMAEAERRLAGVGGLEAGVAQIAAEKGLAVAELLAEAELWRTP